MYDIYTNYINSFINENTNNWVFKSHPDYSCILEHVSKSDGDDYLIEISNKFDLFYNQNKNYLIELCNINDLCGKPTKYEFNNFTCCSPTNLRYILHSLLILTYMKDCGLNNIDIIEIGGGYGGLCFFIYKIAIIFNININTYCIFDLPNPLILQKKYLENLHINNVNFFDVNCTENLKKNSFLISAYAFSEISLDLQKIYTEKILNPYTSHGFLAWNAIDVYNFVKNKNIIKEKEIPLTSFNNYYVYFKPLNNA
jgi:hypothetical protein